MPRRLLGVGKQEALFSETRRNQMKIKITYSEKSYSFEYEGGELDGQTVVMTEDSFGLMLGGMQEQGAHAMAKFLAESTALARKQPGVTVEVTST